MECSSFGYSAPFGDGIYYHLSFGTVFMATVWAFVPSREKSASVFCTLSDSFGLIYCCVTVYFFQKQGNEETFALNEVCGDCIK